MANVNGKRKADDTSLELGTSKKAPRTRAKENGSVTSAIYRDSMLGGDVNIQVVTGSYERILHGISIKIPSDLLQRDTKDTATDRDVTFTDTFLFTPHASSIRCLALSPKTTSNKRTLATGSSDERINLYSISTQPSPERSKPPPVTLETTAVLENPQNRSLGNILHHDRPITRLHFPTKSKLFSAAEDNTIAISRTRDWNVLSSIKVPIPKPQGRPSGDTAGPGEVPAGINDFAIHPSQKLMLTVGRGERCMRLWNLMTGKKAGVLNFERDLLGQVGEGRFGSGEGRRVLWNESGEMFVIAFERAAVVFGIDSKPRAILRPSRPTKLHQIKFMPVVDGMDQDVLAVSTEDGRILFFSISQEAAESADAQSLPSVTCLAELGGHSEGISGRIKDFDVLRLPTTSAEGDSRLLVVAGSSDGAVRIWRLFSSDVSSHSDRADPDDGRANGKTNGELKVIPQVGRLIGTLETGNRITCLGSFVMDESRGDVNGKNDAIPDDEGGQSRSDSESDESD